MRRSVAFTALLFMAPLAACQAPAPEAGPLSEEDVSAIEDTVGQYVEPVMADCDGQTPVKRSRFSEYILNESVGTNGGFEHTQCGIPVNWIVYSPSTIPTGNYELIFDKADFKEGKQSLKFLVHECSATGGWHSPGFTNEYPAITGEPYLISFWIRNEGCEYVVRIGGVDATTGQYETVDSSKDTTESWKLIEHEFTIPQRYEVIRFELSIRSPGSLWIDDIKIERAPGD